MEYLAAGILGWISGFILAKIEEYFRISQPTQYYQVTKDHLDGIIMPGERSEIYLHDGTRTLVEEVVYKGSSYSGYSGKTYPGPSIRLQNCFVRPETFWKNVKTINGRIVIILPYEGI